MLLYYCQWMLFRLCSFGNGNFCDTCGINNHFIISGLHTLGSIVALGNLLSLLASFLYLFNVGIALAHARTHRQDAKQRACEYQFLHATESVWQLLSSVSRLYVSCRSY